MPSLQLTKDQARATQPQAHIWVDASAGTGKTHVLTARVLRLMVEGAKPDSILCVTYTKAAAGEMVNRILSRLGSWATMEPAELNAELAQLLGGASLVTDGHRAQARELFLRVLDLPTGLNVQTLHAFSQSLLGRFPIESATAPGFETIDERTAREYAADARDALLSDALVQTDAHLTNAAHTLARLLADTTFDSVVNELLSMRTVLARLPQTLTGLRHIVKKALGVETDDNEQVISAGACQTSSFHERGLRRVLDAVESAGSAALKARIVEPLKRWLSSTPEQRAAFLNDYALVFLTKEDALRSDRSMLVKAVLSVVPDALEIMKTEGARLQQVKETMKLSQLANETTCVLAFGQHLRQRYSQRKDQTGKLDFSDLIERTRSLLNGSVPASWVMYRLDAQIEHILIDEAQDNSSDQWDIVKKLTEEFFVGLGSQDNPRSVFAVGDMKQSIYGFQGAKPMLFHASKGRFKARAAGVEQPFEDIQLLKSFRSVPAVLQVVDETFRGEAGDGLDANRVSIKHGTHRQGIGGMVDLWPLSVREERHTAEEEGGWRLPLQERWEKRGDRLLAERIAKDIAQRIASKECLPGRSAPLSAGDFLILVRQRGDLMSHLARALRQRAIPIAGLDRFDLKSPLAVRDLVNLGRFASLPQDDYALACVLKSPLCNVREDTLMMLCSNRTGSLWSAVKDDDSLDGTVKSFLTGVLARADFVNPYEFFAEVLERGGRKRLLERLGMEADDAINVFLDQCVLYEQGHVASLDGFLRWLSQSDVDVKRDPETAGDQVRLMTIHGAKGLQAPVVYLADLAGKPRPRNTFVTVQTGPEKQDIPIFRRHSGNDIGPVAKANDAQKRADYEEYKRLLYVAMTRAEDHLICAGYASKDQDDKADKPDPTSPDAYQLITAAFDRLEVPHDSQTGIRRFQTAQTAALPHKPDDAARAQPRLTQLPSWALRAPAPEDNPPRPLQPSDKTLDEPAPFRAAQIEGGDAAVSPARRGSLIHSMLQHLPQYPAKERAAAGHGYLERMLGKGHSTDAATMLEQTMSVLEDPLLVPFFAPSSRAEVPIIARLGDFIVSGQVDRLAICDDTVLFADFKTSQTPPPGPWETPAPTLRQMALYHAALERVFPGKSVQAALIWTVTGDVHWLERDRLLTHLPPGANTAFTRSDA